jgi:AcrR family transcriptional regulator
LTFPEHCSTLRAVFAAAPSTDRPIDRRRAATRREILDAAWALCRERGLAGLSTRELAAKVGLRAPSLYSYFASKDAIYDAMFAEGQIELGARLAFLPYTGVTRADVKAGARAFFEFCTEDPVRHQLMFQRTLPGFVPSEESYALAQTIFDRMSKQLRAAGVRSVRHVDLFTALTTGLIDQQLSNDPGGNRWARLLDDAIDMFCDHASVPETPPRRKR